jgi:hypothetical protein
VRDIYRAGRQRTSDPRGVHLHTIYQRSKGSFIHLGIIQRSIQKVAYVQYFGAYIHVLLTEYNILFVSVLPVVTLKDKSIHLVVPQRTSANPSICPIQKINFTKMPL